MSDEEFLARWSRRKHEARAVVDAPPEPPPPPEQAEAPPNSPPPAAAAHPKDVEVDLSSLPSIESITGTTDITAFLRRGIPPTCAANSPPAIGWKVTGLTAPFSLMKS